MLFDQKLATDILDALNTAKEAAGELNGALLSEDKNTTELISTDLRDLLLTLQNVGYARRKSNPEIKLGQQAECALDSLESVVGLAKSSFTRSQHKLEFELFPMLEEIHAQFYFWACVYPDADRMHTYYESERKILFSNSYVEKAESYGKYKYELSIIVLAYNKLEYTKMCCESILANVPSGLNYELILLNHGSTDGTKEYFERLNPTKQLDFKLNGTELLSVYMRVIEGKYYLHISNDVIVTFNAISNMLITMRDDEKAGGKLAQIVPSTPNVSNLQTITCNYDTLESMHKFAKDNNIYDQFRHEVRTRLCNPIHMVRSRCQWFPYNSPCGLPPISSGQFSFPDDFQSMLFRRAGYRNILAKDAYCYHYGSVTIKDEVKDRQIDANAMYRKGRVTFEEIYGIDPWGTGFCYDPYWVAAVKCEFEGHIEILGVNCGHGSNSLKVKELYKELRHNLNVTLTNVTSDTRYIEDLRGVSDSARIVKTIDEIFEVVKQYHHIVIDDSFYGSVHNLDDLELFYRRLVRGGTMYVNYGAEREPIFKARFPKVEFAGNWAVLSYD